MHGPDQVRLMLKTGDPLGIGRYFLWGVTNFRSNKNILYRGISFNKFNSDRVKRFNNIKTMFNKAEGKGLLFGEYFRYGNGLRDIRLLSSTINKLKAKSFAYAKWSDPDYHSLLLEIINKKGIVAFPVLQASNVPEEEEYIFGGGHRYKIKSVNREKDNLIVRLEQLI